MEYLWAKSAPFDALPQPRAWMPQRDAVTRSRCLTALSTWPGASWHSSSRKLSWWACSAD